MARTRYNPKQQELEEPKPQRNTDNTWDGVYNVLIGGFSVGITPYKVEADTWLREARAVGLSKEIRFQR